MIAPQFLTAREGLADLLRDLAEDIAAQYDKDKAVASGRLKASLSHTVVHGDNATEGTLWGAQYWRYVSNGRPPGRMPPPSELAQWALAKGLTTDPDEAMSIGWAIAKTIQREGSAGFRKGKRNVAVERIEAFQPRIDKLIQDILAKDVETAMVSMFVNASVRTAA